MIKSIQKISFLFLSYAITLAIPLAVSAAVLPTTCTELLNFITGAVAKTVAAFIGAIAIIMLLVAAFQFLTAGGDSDKVKTARQTITWAVIGIIAALISFNIPGILSSFFGGSLPTVCS